MAAAAAILGVVASLVGPAIELGKYFQKQLNYLCCFQTNVNALDDAAKNLADAEADLQVRVDGANRNGEQILNQVETWLAKAEETRLNNTLGIGTQKPRIFNLKSRYSLSRKAIKTAQSMNQLRDTCNFDHVSNPALPASMHHEGRPLTPPGWIESRKKTTEDDIIIAMRERNAYVIGVCGMGGVGKTTMAKQIMNRAKELSEVEAWSMFQENVGACLEDDPNLLPTARDVAKECKGLPLALVAVSRALKDQASKGIWSDALKQLQSSNPMDVPGFIERLPKLQSLCNWVWDVRFPSLEELWTYECPGMKGVTPESIRKQNMEAVRSRRQRVEVD